MVHGVMGIEKLPLAQNSHARKHPPNWPTHTHTHIFRLNIND